jgi:lysozyme
MDRTLLRAELSRDEGVRREPYRDTQGHLTVGIGYNLDVYSLPSGVSFPLSDDEIDILFNKTLTSTIQQLNAFIPWWKSLDEVRQRVIANMAFNLGVVKLTLFKRTLAAIKDGDYATAADEMQQSDWFDQVGDRAVRLCQAMRTGVMP